MCYSQVDLQHDVKSPSPAETPVYPVQGRRVLLIVTLHDGSPNPDCSEKSHHEDIRDLGSLVQGEALPVEEGPKEEVCCNLG